MSDQVLSCEVEWSQFLLLTSMAEGLLPSLWAGAVARGEYAGM